MQTALTTGRELLLTVFHRRGSESPHVSVLLSPAAETRNTSQTPTRSSCVSAGRPS